MKWKMAENSLFAVLLRSQWWWSVLVAIGVFAVVRLFMAWGYALFAVSPFIVIAAMAAWRQLRVPSGARLEKSLAGVRALSWEDFSRTLEAHFASDGYAVKRIEGVADFELEKSGRVSLVSARRWKASRTGVEPLKELAAAGDKRGAAECLYVVAGEMSEQAGKLATEKGIRLVAGASLIKLLKR
ncbi:MAG: restriction endonuclease [Burkholderiales bacterium]